MYGRLDSGQFDCRPLQIGSFLSKTLISGISSNAQFQQRNFDSVIILSGNRTSCDRWRRRNDMMAMEVQKLRGGGRAGPQQASPGDQVAQWGYSAPQKLQVTGVGVAERQRWRSARQFCASCLHPNCRTDWRNQSIE